MYRAWNAQYVVINRKEETKLIKYNLPLRGSFLQNLQSHHHPNYPFQAHHPAKSENGGISAAGLLFPQIYCPNSHLLKYS